MNLNKLFKKVAMASLATIAASSILVTATPAQAAVPTVKQVVAASFYNCSNASSWTLEPSNWQLKYPTVVNGKYWVYAVTAYGVFNLAVRTANGYALVQPADSLSKKLWVIQKCPASFVSKANYSYTNSLFNGGGPMD